MLRVLNSSQGYWANRYTKDSNRVQKRKSQSVKTGWFLIGKKVYEGV